MFSLGVVTVIHLTDGMAEWDDAMRDRWPDTGVLTIAWQAGVVEGRRRLSWIVTTDPPIEADLRLALLRQEADELAGDIELLTQRPPGSKHRPESSK